MYNPFFKKNDDAVIRQYGTGYYRATFLFSKEIREATWIYYSFLRSADEIVDTAIDEHVSDRLSQFRKDWELTVRGDTSNALFTAYKKVLDQYKIPIEYSTIFLDTMERDITVSRYMTYADLEAYMYGSAIVVGYTMSHIIGFESGALPYAKALAEAFQMTNFLRDIYDDYEDRGRIYLPQEDMDRYGVTETHIAERTVDDAWRALMQYEVARTRALYEKGMHGIALLHPRGRRAVYAAALIYKEILDKIEERNYDVFANRVVISPFRKTVLLLKAVCKRKL